VSSPRQIVASLEDTDRGIRLDLVGRLGKVRRRKDQKGYFLDFRPYGRVYSNRGIALDSRRAAERLLAQIQGQVGDGAGLVSVLAHFLPVESKPNLVPQRLAQWLEVRRREEASGTLSPRTLEVLESYCRPAGHFSFFASLSIFEIRYATLEDFSLWLADRSQSPKSRRNILSAFRGFLSWLKRRGEIREVPSIPLPRAEEYEPRILSIEDQDRVLAAIPDDERGIFLGLGRLGLRPGEARALAVTDYRDGWLTVDKAFKGKFVASPIRGTKTGKPKRLPVGEELGDWIEKHVDPAARLTQSFLFVNPRTGGPWTHRALENVWRKAIAQADVPYVPLYEGTKHTFATDAIRRGVPERLLQRFLGHADVHSTRRYARLADNALVAVLRPEEARLSRPSHRLGTSQGQGLHRNFRGNTSDYWWAPRDSNPGEFSKKPRKSMYLVVRGLWRQCGSDPPQAPFRPVESCTC